MTLIEVAAILSVLATLAAVVSPTVGGVFQRARQARAQMEVNAIAMALVEYARDVKTLPGAERPDFGSPLVLVTEGDMPHAAQYHQSLWGHCPRAATESYLVTRPAGVASKWKGPYLPMGLKTDPWGRAYLINVGLISKNAGASEERRAVFVISAGANGVIDTPLDQFVTNAQVLGDDVSSRIQ